MAARHAGSLASETIMNQCVQTHDMLRQLSLGLHSLRDLNLFTSSSDFEYMNANLYRYVHLWRSGRISGEVKNHVFTASCLVESSIPLHSIRVHTEINAPLSSLISLLCAHAVTTRVRAGALQINAWCGSAVRSD